MTSVDALWAARAGLVSVTPGALVAEPLAALMESLAALTTASAVMPNSRYRVGLVGGGAEVLDADDAPGVADHVVPAHRDPRLDADAGPDCRRQDLVLVGPALLLEPLPARHRHDAGRDAGLLEALGGLDGELHLGAGGDEDDVGVTGRDSSTRT